MSALIVAFRRLLYLFHDVKRGGILGSMSFVRMGQGEWLNPDGLALCHTQRSSTLWDPYLYLTLLGRNRNAQHSLHQQLDR